MRRLTIISLALAAMCAPAMAQNINQSVEVTNEYETRFSDIQKSAVELKVPDSLYRFDYKFDYSVFDAPYKGSYEFTPYEIKATPEAVGYDGRKFYLRAGAGYTLHPVLDFVYAPVTKDNLAISVYNEGNGYLGNYVVSGQAVPGHDFADRFGVDAHLSFGNNVADAHVGYDGVFAGLDETSIGFNSAFASLGLGSNSFAPFTYRAALDYRFSNDAHVDGKLVENNLGLTGFLGPRMVGARGLLVDYEFRVVNLADYRTVGGNASSIKIGATPKYALSLGPVDIDAGIRLDYVSHSGEVEDRFSVAPDVKASLSILHDNLRVLAGFEGGQTIRDLYSFKSVNHFYTKGYDGIGVVSEYQRFGTYLGAQLHYKSHLQLDFKGGFSMYEASPMESGYGFFSMVDYNLLYAKLKTSWSSERLQAEGGFLVAKTFAPDAIDVFAPSLFCADAKVTYNWLNRIFAGVSVKGATAREFLGERFEAIPGYVDLGLHGEYKIARKWGVWGHVGNILGMKIEEHPGYAVKGPYLTAGICLSL